jgi:hypothetical protein
MEALIKYMASSLVDDPTQVEIHQFRRGSSITYELTVAKDDMGRVIGKGGRVASAMRSLLRVAAALRELESHWISLTHNEQENFPGSTRSGTKFRLTRLW